MARSRWCRLSDPEQVGFYLITRDQVSARVDDRYLEIFNAGTADWNHYSRQRVSDQEVVSDVPLPAEVAPHVRGLVIYGPVEVSPLTEHLRPDRIEGPGK